MSLFPWFFYSWICISDSETLSPLIMAMKVLVIISLCIMHGQWTYHILKEIFSPFRAKSLVLQSIPAAKKVHF